MSLKRWPMVLVALGIWATFGCARLAGLDELTTFLTGVGKPLGVLLGTIYLVLYFLAVLVAPVLVLATALLAAFRRIEAVRASPQA